MVYRIYSEKRPEFSEAAEGLAKDIREFLGIRTLEGVRIINRYDAEGVDEATFNACIETVFSGFFSVFLPTLLSARIFRIIYSRNEKHIIAVQIIISVSDSAGATL